MAELSRRVVVARDAQRPAGTAAQADGAAGTLALEHGPCASTRTTGSRLVTGSPIRGIASLAV